jgi:hypothetical protein
VVRALLDGTLTLDPAIHFTRQAGQETWDTCWS